MEKPKIFISSTVYDFKDLRSALRYWLSELDYDVQLSERCDFDKDSSKNSYDACLEAIPECDIFILLIGSRVGGMYDDENNISITRKEYQTAYELANAGKIKKIITFVRQSVWDVLEDRKGLEKLLSEIGEIENGKLSENDIANYNSKILNGAEHIKSFVDEVRHKPSFNWVHQFNEFSDIASVLSVELRIKTNVHERVAEQNIKLAVINNARELFHKENGKITAQFNGFTRIHKKLLLYKERLLAEDIDIESTLSISRDELTGLVLFVIGYNYGVDRLTTSVFEDAISSGIFSKYNKAKDTFIFSSLHNSLIDIISEIKKLKTTTSQIIPDKQWELIESIRHFRKSSAKEFQCKYLDIAPYWGAYWYISNILDLSKYIIEYIDSRGKINTPPVLIRGIVGDTRPSKNEILWILQNRGTDERQT